MESLVRVRYKKASDFGDRGFTDRFKNPGLLLGPVTALIWDHVEGYSDERQEL
ncbi:MAG TPA: hypothetical protein V6D08_10645 [Candidatus Obscuribacterales bacterium]